MRQRQALVAVVVSGAPPRPELAPRDRSLITVAGLIASGNIIDQLQFHLPLAKANGVTEADLNEVIIHLAFYAGWPRSVNVMGVAQRPFAGEDEA